jgi:DnaJ-class molecular chaperone
MSKKCKECNGTGRIEYPWGHIFKCPKCKGEKNMPKYIVRVEVETGKNKQRDAEYLIDEIINRGIGGSDVSKYGSIQVLFKGADYK